MQRRTFMTFLSTVVVWTVGQMWIIMLVIYHQRLSACARMMCARIHFDASSARKNPLIACFIEKRGHIAESAKVNNIVDWTFQKVQKDRCKWLGLAKYLHKYSANNADMTQSYFNFLKRIIGWCWIVAQYDNF